MRTWQRTDQFVGTTIDDSYVLLDIDRAAYVTFNSSAGDIWELLGNPKTVDEIADSLVAKYDVARDHCLRSIQRLLDELAAKGLVRAAG